MNRTHTKHILGAILGLAQCLAAPLHAQTIPADYSVARYLAQTNSTGIATGFWANDTLQSEAIRDFGFRSVDRVGFTKWKQVQATRNSTYSWNGTLSHYKSSKRSGANVIASVNVAHSLDVNENGMDAIPTGYVQRITDATTREAGKAFLRAFVQKMLTEVGAFTLLIDYEMIWFYNTRVAANRAEYQDWYVTHAVPTARKAAADLGKASWLKIGICVNGRPLDDAWEILGGSNPPNHIAQQWLLKCVAVSDVFCMDLYHFDPARRTNADFSLKELRFWRDHYSDGKPLWITEVGYSTINSARPGYVLPPWDYKKAHGTEAQQSAYYNDFLTKLASDADLRQRVKVLCLWSYMDQRDYNDPEATSGSYYGLARRNYAGANDGFKPAAFTVANLFNSWAASNSTLRPSTHTWQADLTGALKNPSTTSNLTYTDGQNHQFLKGSFTLPATSKGERFVITTTAKSNPLLTLNGMEYPLIENEGATTHSIDISSGVNRGGTNHFVLRLTKEFLPFTHGVKVAYPTYQ